MNERFREHIESLDPSFQRLLAMPAFTVESLPRHMPESGIYLFSEQGQHLYVGRSDNLRGRVQAHCRASSRQNVAAFAFRMARKVTGMTTVAYSLDGSRSDLELRPVFSAEFIRQKQRIRTMELRFVEEADPMRQALLEMYVAVALGTPHNDFENH